MHILYYIYMCVCFINTIMPLVFTTLDQKAMIQWWHLDLHQVDVYHAAHDPRTQAAQGTEFHGEVGFACGKPKHP